MLTQIAETLLVKGSKGLSVWGGDDVLLLSAVGIVTKILARIACAADSGPSTRALARPPCKRMFIFTLQW